MQEIQIRGGGRRRRRRRRENNKNEEGEEEEEGKMGIKIEEGKYSILLQIT